MKKKMRLNIVFVALVFLGGYLVVANIHHIALLSQKEQIDFTLDPTMELIRTNLNQIDSNINIINDTINTGGISVEDFLMMKENLNHGYENIKNMKMITYKGKKSFLKKDLYRLLQEIKYPHYDDKLNDVYHIMKQYDSSLDKMDSIFFAHLEESKMSLNILEQSLLNMNRYQALKQTAPQIPVLLNYLNSYTANYVYITSWLVEHTERYENDEK